MSSLSTSYSETNTSTSDHSSSDESEVKREPSKHPEPKVIIREAPQNMWAPKGDVPVATVVPQIVAPILSSGLLQYRPPHAASREYTWSIGPEAPDSG